VLDGPTNSVWIDPWRNYLESRGVQFLTEAEVEGIGYPTEPEEIDWFMTMLKKGAPSLTRDDAQVIEQWLRKGAGS
jgi:uncharacterized protein with NAD-binding domain and iron-sulfur cluster